MADLFYYSRGIWTTTFRDADLTLTDTRHIVVPVFTAQTVAQRLEERYANNFLLSAGNFNSTYLISGVIVQANRISSSTDRKYDEIVMDGENRDTMNLVAQVLDLPKIWEKSFLQGSGR